MADRDAKDVDWKDLLARLRIVFRRDVDRVEWHIESDTVRGMSEDGPPERAKQ